MSYREVPGFAPEGLLRRPGALSHHTIIEYSTYNVLRIPATSEKKVETLNLYLLFCCFILYIVRYLYFETIYSIFLMDGAIRNI